MSETTVKAKGIANEYINEGLVWRIAERVGNIAIAVKVGGNLSYEVVRIRRRKPKEFLKEDMSLEYIEFLPSNEDFGKFGWSFMDKTLAYACYARELAEQKRRNQELLSGKGEGAVNDN
jgi:hypothetical protein